MMKILSYILIVTGVAFLAFGGYQLFESKSGQNEATAEAQSIIESRDTTPKYGSNPEELSKSFQPGHGDVAGQLLIPKLEAELPIIEGTHEDDLAKGVGHYSGTSYPLGDDQIVLSGHRDTVFRSMGELQIGDIFIMQMEYGDFTYEIAETKIVDADDRTIIVPHDEEVLTVTTCYPFNFIGSAPDRYIIYAYPVD